MRQRTYWRELLDMIIHTYGERKRIARAISVAEVTLSRWASGESSPRQRYFRPLLQAIPGAHRHAFEASMKEEFPSLAVDLPGQDMLVYQESMHEHEKLEIPFAFVNRILGIHATSFTHQVSWMIIQQTLQHARLQLSSGLGGLRITIFYCMPPRDDGMIRSLREGPGLGTFPWSESLGEEVQFLGADTLVGHTVATARSHQVSDLRAAPTLVPYRPAEYERSAATYPMMRHGRLAGCVLFSSTEVGRFECDRLAVLLQAYTNLIALAFTESDFYDVSVIQLQVMPAFEAQQQYLSRFRALVITLMKESAHTAQDLTYQQAVTIAWQQVETLLLQHHDKHNDLPQTER
ncbi:MAG: GAF domain-containing protein [Chloroflexi bacterium]|nr:MAG: GAF domain-containing protein [Chloroflexota bacterium]